MSTRCGILISDYRGFFWRLYHHTDGSPDKVGKELKAFIKYLVTCEKDSGLVSSDLVLTLNSFDPSYEIESNPHGDEEYFYKIFVGKETISIRCWNKENIESDDPKDWSLIEEFTETYKIYE